MIPNTIQVTIPKEFMAAYQQLTHGQRKDLRLAMAQVVMDTIKPVAVTTEPLKAEIQKTRIPTFAEFLAQSN